MVYVKKWETGEEIANFHTEEETSKWISENCTTENGRPWRDEGPLYYRGERLQIWYGETVEMWAYKYAPKRLYTAIKQAYKDSDGYWIVLYPGWIDTDMGGQTLHTDTLKQMREALRNVQKVRSY